MLRRVLPMLIVLVLIAPALAEQVDIRHPQIKDGSKGLFVDGKAYVPIDVVNQLMPDTFAWDPDHRAIVSPNVGARRKPVLVVGDRESMILDLLRRAGVPIEQADRLPGQFGGYSAILFADDQACDPTRAGQLEQYVKKGGGIILTGRQATLLAGSMETDRLGSVGAWFGAGYVTDHDTDRLYAKCQVGHPFGVRIEKQEKLWSGGGGTHIAGVDSEHLGGSSESLVIAETTHMYPDTFIFAFAHPYGPGRVYWQSIVPPDYPKLMQLFVAGTKWAGGFIDRI